MTAAAALCASPGMLFVASCTYSIGPGWVGWRGWYGMGRGMWEVGVSVNEVIVVLIFGVLV